MECPHCGGLIEIVAGQPQPDQRQAELPFMVELRLPHKHAKKVIDAPGAEFQFGARDHVPSSLVHDHVHDLEKKNGIHVHDHVHVARARRIELTPAQRDLLDQIEELCGGENRTAHFRTTWVMRIIDYPNQVFAAIGEARAAKREGRVRKSVGGVLNWHFTKFREGARKSA